MQHCSENEIKNPNISKKHVRNNLGCIYPSSYTAITLYVMLKIWLCRLKIIKSDKIVFNEFCPIYKFFFEFLKFLDFGFWILLVIINESKKRYNIVKPSYENTK